MDKYLDGWGILEINEYTNYDIFLKYKNLDNNNKWNEARKIEKEAFETKVYYPTKGKYILKNENQIISFEINEKGQFDGECEANLRVNGIIRELFKFYYKEGIAEKTEVRNTDNILIKVIEKNDSTFSISKFEKGVLDNKFIWKENRKYPAMNIYYYENGNIKSEINQIEKTYITYYENGNIEKFENKKTNELIDYDEQGKKINRVYYKSDKIKCEESFRNNLINKQNCYDEDLKIDTERFYKNGNLEYYIILDYKKEQKRTYDKNEKLIKTEKFQNWKTKLVE